MSTEHKRALTVQELIEDLQRQNNPDLKLKVAGNRRVTKVKYIRSAGKPFLELITSE